MTNLENIMYNTIALERIIYNKKADFYVTDNGNYCFHIDALKA